MDPNKAYELLEHYLRTAWERTAWSSDNSLEIRELVEALTGQKVTLP